MLLECCFQQPRWLRHSVGSFSFCESKKILVHHVTTSMCSSARPLRLEMYRCISDEVLLGAVMKLWYIMINHWWETQMVLTTPRRPPPVRECLRGYCRAFGDALRRFHADTASRGAFFTWFWPPRVQKSSLCQYILYRESMVGPGSVLESRMARFSIFLKKIKIVKLLGPIL